MLLMEEILLEMVLLIQQHWLYYQHWLQNQGDKRSDWSLNPSCQRNVAKFDRTCCYHIRRKRSRDSMYLPYMCYHVRVATEGSDSPVHSSEGRHRRWFVGWSDQFTATVPTFTNCAAAPNYFTSSACESRSPYQCY